MATCSKCGEEKDGRGLKAHELACKGGGVAVMERPEPRSSRARTKYAEAAPTPLEQVRRPPGGVTGPWLYCLRPGGATIRDVLILVPNGGEADSADPKVRMRHGRNSELYQMKERKKGFIPLGSKLDERAVKMIVEEISKNREEEINYMLDEIDDCDRQLANVENPGWRDVFRKRKARAQARLETLQNGFDPDALLKDLNDIARGQQLAKLDPNVLAVMKEMFSEQDKKVANYFRNGKDTSAPEGVRMQRGGGNSSEFGGFVDIDE